MSRRLLLVLVLVLLAGSLVVFFSVRRARMAGPAPDTNFASSPAGSGASPGKTLPAPATLLPQAAPLCDAAFSAPPASKIPPLKLEEGTLFALRQSERTNPYEWKPFYDPLSFISARAASDVEVLACIHESRKEVTTMYGMEPDSGKVPGFQLFWSIRILHWPDGAILAQTNFSGSHPGPVEMVHSGEAAAYGGEPIVEFHLWLASKAGDPTILRELGTSRALAFLPDGKSFVSAGELGLISWWSPTNPHKIRSQNVPATLDQPAFSPDGKFLAAAIDFQDLVVFDAASARVIRRWKPAETVQTLGLSPGGKILIVGEMENVLRFWDVPTGRDLRALRVHTKGIHSVVFSADGAMALTLGPDFIVVWEAATGRELRRIPMLDRACSELALSPDGLTIAVGCDDGGITLFELATGREVAALHGHTQSLTALVFSPDGRILASGSLDHDVKLWDVASAKELRTLRGHGSLIAALAFSREGKLLVSSDFEGVIKLWDLAATP